MLIAEFGNIGSYENKARKQLESLISIVFPETSSRTYKIYT